jgi:hypothetical protein
LGIAQRHIHIKLNRKPAVKKTALNSCLPRYKRLALAIVSIERDKISSQAVWQAKWVWHNPRFGHRLEVKVNPMANQ